jgi:hypothetical protein
LSLLKSLFKAFFYLFALVLVVGVWDIKNVSQNSKSVLYVVLLSAFSFALLYVHVLLNWTMYPRFAVIVFLPMLPFLGHGLQRMKAFLEHRFGMKQITAFFVLFTVILVFTLPKNLKEREEDKEVFVRIASVVASQEEPDRAVKVATSIPNQRWLSFYSNLSFKGAPCPQNFDLCWENYNGSFDNFIRTLHEKDIGYVLWDEVNWASSRVDPKLLDQSRQLVLLGRWHHRDTGDMLLYRVNGHGDVDTWADRRCAE